ncbi:methyl-accepting chemotaxis protein [Novosphingobium sp. Rr 2-17]|uniref:methyl-accepting chemotaxis protein n=1 Tax=Novosphingobium sp. Rr 2-17 TaxID=555793 RepID=UPI00178C3046|nr:methyl-accepting chemotaxis protein [Novosphingobium sp. Rr 2-17]
MGGPIQTQSQQTSDLVADVLPPPAYVIEAYLEATLLLRDPADQAGAAKRLAKLHDDYRTRLDFWAKAGIDPENFAALAASKPPADAFWTEIEERYLPAARANDRPAMLRSYTRISSAYSEHRRAIDILVKRAITYQAGLADRAAKALHRALVMLSIIGLIIVGCVAAFCAMLLRRVVTPIVSLSTTTAALARGEPASVPFVNRTDELGSIAVAVDSFRRASEARTVSDAAAASEQQIVNDALADVVRTMGNGDLTRRADIEFPDSYREIGDSLNSAVGTLRSMIKTVVETASDIEGGAGKIATASEDLARRTQSNAASLEQTSAALVQIDTRLRSAAKASADTIARADTALATVASGRSVAVEAVQAMSRVTASAQGTNAVIEGLDKIAFQTRVLAMNAAVEAGRAGDAGRGFSVVADLVSALAQRAEEEAKSARDQLTTAQMEIVTAVAAVEHVDTSLAEIARNVGDVHDLLGGMVTDNQAQSQAVSEIAAAVGAMDQSTQQNAAMVEETSAAASDLSARIQSMVQQAAAFKFERRPRDAAGPFNHPGGGGMARIGRRTVKSQIFA